MLDILTGLDKLILFSLPLANGVTVFPGAMVTVDANGKVILATTNNTPWYICISDSEEPMVKAAGTVALIAGDARCLTDNFVEDADLEVGTELAIAPGGKLEIAEKTVVVGGEEGTTVTVKNTVVGYVERVVAPGATGHLPLAIVRML